MKKPFNIKDITEPKQGYIVYKDHFWLCVDGDPKQALFYKDMPQCNADKRVHEWALKTENYVGFSNLQITFIALAYLPPRY
jgi:hypothetical protein